MAINLLEDMEEKFTHTVQIGDIYIPIFRNFSFVYTVGEVVGECVVHFQLA